jgi:hypothetical protein
LPSEWAAATTRALQVLEFDADGNIVEPIVLPGHRAPVPAFGLPPRLD